MDITLTVVPRPDAGFATLLGDVAAAAESGFARVWLPQLPPIVGANGWDALTALAVAGARTPGIGLGSSVAVAYGQHPLVLARQALTVAAATEGRFVLGLGVSHRFVVADVLGYSYDAPAAYLREYLEVLGPALAGQSVDHHGPRITAVGKLESSVAAPQIVIAALGPRMLELAGALTAGTLTTWTGPKALENHVIPRITRAAEDARRPAPQVIVGLPVSVTDDVEGTRAEINAAFAVANEVPAYRGMLEREGVGSVADLCLGGDEDEVVRGLRRFADLGVTEFSAVPTGDDAARARTETVLREVALAAV